MKHARSKGLAVVLVSAMAAMALGGCYAKQERQLDILRGRNSSLTVQKSKLQGQLNALRVRLKDVQERSSAKISSLQARLAGAAGGASAIRLANGKTLLYRKTLGGDLLFASGRATLTASGRKALAKVVAKLKSRYAGRLVRVYGYTDGDPIVKTRKLWQDNLDLSANRAMAVSRYLISKGIKRDLIETIAMGAARPVASNRTKAGKAGNRRVEIVVVRK